MHLTWNSRIILRLIALGVILLITWVVLRPGLTGGFFFDDVSNIVNNEAIHADKFTISKLRQSVDGPVAGPLGRPVSVLSFALTHIFFGLDAYSFKAINLAIHMVNGLLIAWLIRLLLESPVVNVSPNVRDWLPVWASLAWLIHPINILPVLLAVQRMTLLATMFLLLAFISHLVAERTPGTKKWLWFSIAWLAFWPLAVFSKETGLLFPVYLLTITFFLRERSFKKNPYILWLVGFLISMALIAMSSLGWNWLDQAYQVRSFTLTERLLTEARVLWFYAAQIIGPNFFSFGIYLDDIPISTSLINPISTAISITGWSIMLLVVYLGRKRQPILCLGITWFLVGHCLESTFLPLEIAHEYRNYLPSVGLILAAGHVGGTGLQKLNAQQKKLFGSLIAIIPLIILALFTWMRANQLGNTLLSTQIEASRHPLSPRANYDAAHALFKAGLGDKTDPLGAQQIRYYFLESANLDKSQKHAHVGLIVWACASERPIEPAWVDKLSNRFANTPFAPGDRRLARDLLNQLLYMPACLSREQAVQLFESGAQNQKSDPLLRANFYEAASDYELLISLDPGSARNYLVHAVKVAPEDGRLKKKLETFNAHE